MKKATSLQSALAIAQPKMADSINKIDQGTVLLVIWAAKGMRWSDVGVTKDETSFALVQKDPDETRGKRLCASGSIVQIEIQKLEVGKVFEGLLSDYRDHLYKFYAAGSTGELVERSQARFCGVVTGKFDYSNSGGGTGHAISVVGMFDLPANRSSPAVP